jgi:hypothetical protein
MAVAVRGTRVIEANRRPDLGEGAYVRIAQSADDRPGIGSAVLQFFWQRKWWWLSPIILMVLWLVAVSLFTPSRALPTTELYNLFSTE